MQNKLISILAIVLLLAGLLSGCSETKDNQNNPQGNSATQSSTVQTGKTVQQPEQQKEQKYEKAVVTKIVDGDTFYVRLEGGQEIKVRPIGVNCPELSHPNLGIKEQPYGKEAKEFTESQLLGKTVYLEKDVSNTDKYGRLLRYVWLEIPQTNTEDEIKAKMFNAVLLEKGYAQVMTVPPDVKYADLFVNLQREARENKAGLWSLPVPPENGEKHYKHPKK
jgi:micrococcal nuclease